MYEKSYTNISLMKMLRSFAIRQLGFEIEGAMTPKVSIYPPPSGKQQFVR